MVFEFGVCVDVSLEVCYQLGVICGEGLFGDIAISGDLFAGSRDISFCVGKEI